MIKFWAIKLKSGVWQGLPEEPSEVRKDDYQIKEFVDINQVEEAERVAEAFESTLGVVQDWVLKTRRTLETMMTLGHHSIDEEKWRLEEILASAELIDERGPEGYDKIEKERDKLLTVVESSAILNTNADPKNRNDTRTLNSIRDRAQQLLVDIGHWSPKRREEFNGYKTK